MGEDAQSGGNAGPTGNLAARGAGLVRGLALWPSGIRAEDLGLRDWACQGGHLSLQISVRLIDPGVARRNAGGRERAVT